MSLEILKCNKCNKFLLNKICTCGEKVNSPLPPKYSPDDNYAKYRRQAKETARKEIDLI